MKKTPPGKRVPGTLQHPPLEGTVTVSVIRKHSVRQYETLDVQVSVTASANEGETQTEVTERIYRRLKPDIVKISDELLAMAKSREL